MFVVEFLGDEIFTENGAEFLSSHGLKGTGIEKRCGLVLHISPYVVPGGRDLVLGEIDLVGNLLIVVCHGFSPFALNLCGFFCAADCVYARDKTKTLSQC